MTHDIGSEMRDIEEGYEWPSHFTALSLFLTDERHDLFTLFT